MYEIIGIILCLLALIYAALADYAKHKRDKR